MGELQSSFNSLVFVGIIMWFCLTEAVGFAYVCFLVCAYIWGQRSILRAILSYSKLLNKSFSLKLELA